MAARKARPSASAGGPGQTGSRRKRPSVRVFPPDQVRGQPLLGMNETRQKRRYVRFTRWRRRRFFALLAESGNVQMAAEEAGVSQSCIYRLRRVEAGFTELMAAAVAAADARLREEERACPHPPKADALGPSLSPSGRGEEGLVVRRGRGGRLRVMAAGTRWWQARHDAVFLGHLRETGNISASARAAGFTPKSAWNRREALPGFARAWDAAMEDAEIALEFRLLHEAAEGIPAMEPGAAETARAKANATGTTVPFDPWLALWILKWRDGRRGGPASGG